VTVTGGVPVDGIGGSVSISGGIGATITATNRNGGNVTITGGAPALAGNGGQITISGGAVTTGTAGSVTINGGASGTSGSGGAVTVQGGTATEGVGGAVTITARAGATATSTNRNGGAVAINTGAAVVGGTGGTLNITLGAGGTTGTGGSLVANAGAGGSTSGNGGSMTFTSGLPIDGNGGSINITASPGATTTAANRDGGNVVIQAGAKTNAGTDGSIQLKDSAAAVKFKIDSTGIAFFAGATTAKQTVTGSRGGNAALASLLTALAAYTLITDSTTA
jgi:hypothetical protein